MDQKMVSIRIAEWMDRNNDEEFVYKVSDQGFKRIDRISWDAERLNEDGIRKRYDTHLLINGYLPNQWKRMKPLIKLMYTGRESWKAKWCDQYAQSFYKKIKNNVSHSNYLVD